MDVTEYTIRRTILGRTLCFFVSLLLHLVCQSQLTVVFSLGSCQALSLVMWGRSWFLPERARNLERRRRLKTLSHSPIFLDMNPGTGDDKDLKMLSSKHHVPSLVRGQIHRSFYQSWNGKRCFTWRGLDMAKFQLHHRTRPDPGCHVDPSLRQLLPSAHLLSTFSISVSSIAKNLSLPYFAWYLYLYISA